MNKITIINLICILPLIIDATIQLIIHGYNIDKLLIIMLGFSIIVYSIWLDRLLKQYR